MERVISRKFTVSRTENSKKLSGTVIVDMTGVTEAMLVEAAVRAKVISMQAALRKLAETELEKVLSNGPIRRKFNSMGCAFESSARAKLLVEANLGMLSKVERRVLLEAQLLALAVDDDEVAPDTEVIENTEEDEN